MGFEKQGGRTVRKRVSSTKTQRERDRHTHNKKVRPADKKRTWRDFSILHRISHRFAPHMWTPIARLRAKYKYGVRRSPRVPLSFDSFLPSLAKNGILSTRRRGPPFHVQDSPVPRQLFLASRINQQRPGDETKRSPRRDMYWEDPTEPECVCRCTGVQERAILSPPIDGCCGCCTHLVHTSWLLDYCIGRYNTCS